MADLAVWQRTIVDEKGNVIPGAEIEVRREEDDSLATLYADRAGETPLANPLAADMSGFVRFFAQGDAYTITAVGAGSTRTWRFDPTGRLQEFDRVSEALNADGGVDIVSARSNLGTFSTITAVQNSHIPAVLMSVEVQGFADPGDGGGVGLRRASSEPDHPGKVQSADGAWWEYVHNGRLDARAFGANPSRNDNQGALNDAIKVLGGKGEVVVADNYDITGPIEVPNGASITLKGVKGAGLRRAAGSPAFNLIYHSNETIVDRLEIHNVILDGNYTSGDSLGSGSTVIFLDGGSTDGVPDCGTFVLRNSLLKNWSSFGMGVHPKGYRHVFIENNLFFGSGNESASSPLFHAIYVRRYSRATVTGNIISDIGSGGGIKVQAAGASPDASAYVAGNFVANVAARGVYVADGGRAVVTGNDIRNVGQYAIIATQDVSSPPFEHLIITDNMIEGVRQADGGGIQVNASYRNGRVAGNILTDFGSRGISLRSTQRCFVSENTFVLTADNQQESVPAAIYVGTISDPTRELHIGVNTFRFAGGAQTQAVYLDTTDVTAGTIRIEPPNLSAAPGSTITPYTLGVGPSYTVSNAPVLGSVSMTEGLPTGAILERGSNEKGEYIRYADGTQICWRFLFPVAEADIDSRWNFPAIFTDSPSFSATMSGASPLIVGRGGINESYVAVRAWSLAGARIAGTCDVMAIGRWA